MGRFERVANDCSGGLFDRGTYVAPTVVDGLPLDHELFKKELFLPLVVVAPVKNLDEALDEANDTEYGLTAGIFTEDREEITRFFDRIEAGRGLRQPQGWGDNRRLARLPVICRLESVR